MRRALRSRAVAGALLVVVTASSFATQAGAIALITGLGGSRDYGEGVLAANDDGSTGAIDITSIFGPGGLNFFGTNYTVLYINNNGNVTFTGPLATYTPFGISGGSTPIIAPFFADVDTGGAHVPADSNLVYYDIDAINGVFTATWDLVGYYGGHTDKLNDFQLRLINQGGGNFDIEFRYGTLQWTTGDASGGSGGLGGTPARAGYSAGDQTNYAELPASGDQAAMLDLVNQSNVGNPGLFLFAVNNGQVQICGNGVLEGFEECDDDGNANGDGCSASCTVESCWDCSGQPSACTPEPSGNGCDDGLFCTGSESCNGSGACVGSGDPCAGGGECADACDESTDTCFDPAGSSCGDTSGSDCTAPDTCDGAGACQPNHATSGATCGDPSDSDCTDPDTCDGAGTCQPNDSTAGAVCGDPTDSECTEPDTCDGVGTCQPNHALPGAACGDPSDSDCTDPDTCDGDGSCLPNHASLATPCADDGQLCTLDQCNGAGTCMHPAGNAGTECRAASGACDVAEQCDGASASCPPDQVQPDGTDCSDAAFCDGPEQCQGGSCVSAGPPPCTAPSECNESQDRCGCPAAPATGCRSAGKATLIVKDNENDLFDKLVWQWIRGESTAQAELGDPTSTTDYSLCVYAGATSDLVGEAALPPGGGLWRPLGDKGYKYKDLTLANDGVLKLVAKGSDKDTALASMKGRGPNLPDLTLPLPLPVTAQLINGESGICLDSSFGSADVSQNRAPSEKPGLFRAKTK